MNSVFQGGKSGQHGQYSESTRVADVMTKGVITLNPNNSFAKAVELMATGNFRHLVIADEEQKVLGVISDRDIFRCQSRIAEWQVKQVGEVMTSQPITVTPETLLSVAVSTMVSKKINCLPVVEDTGTVCGIVTSTDIMKSYHSMLESMEHTR